MGKQTGVGVKFILIVSCITLVLMGLMAVVIITSAGKSEKQLVDRFATTLKNEQAQQVQMLRNGLIEKAKSLSLLLSQDGASLIVGYDFDTLQQLADNAMKDRDVGNVVFYDKDGKPLTKAYENKKGMEAVKQEIKFDKELIGFVEIHVVFDYVSKKSEELSARVTSELANADKKMADSSWHLAYMVAGVALTAIVVLCLAVFLCLTRFIIKPVERISRGLDVAAGEVDSASDELASSGQQLAEGASQQAASLEETSATLEEVSTMTRLNADNASQCDTLMQEVNSVVERASASIAEQTMAMEEIDAASRETQKIVKTIDEIAFQTNLLALNAAVEAARAGEAGAGFAVVADEVRNLAMRAAEAARNTAELIESTVNKIKAGTRLASRTNEDFSEVAGKAGKVGALVSEIAAASSEQNQGLSQVNKAVAEIDEVVQHTAANAEESASASEELSAHADQMKRYVKELVGLLKGGSTDNATGGANSLALQHNRDEDDLHHSAIC